ncbi:hypothetical protein [Mariprofundus sp. KV]|uniref:hypothetical protein n=1 Tax=Mariprofundus sp. KV TaxID=2608715 RepID=UPI0015A4DCAC|nr:hypothetical protein [Mariprofundus sp. KV]NWF37185.1 hypothetical protein [Mariprofundus sp. KV]
MHFSCSKPLILLSLLLISLSGCSNLEAIYEEGRAKLFSSTGKSDKLTAMDRQLQAVDRANDRVAARNELVRQMIAESDSACEKELGIIADDIENWKIDNRAPGPLGEKLEAAIAKRQFDTGNTKESQFVQGNAEPPAKALANAIVETIKRNRNKARSTLDERMEASINHYSLKQALMDLDAYHNLCTTALGASQLARSTSVRMSPEEKSAAIDSLVQMRKKLMQEGINPRSIQRKIDDIIMAE